MDEVAEDLGRLNPNAPPELARLAFLVGRWRCDARVKLDSGEWQTFQATWVGRFILDGYAIADEYRMTDSSGATVVLGLNIRSYDAAKRRWNMRWLHASTGAWVELGPEELGGVRFDGRSMVYLFEEPMAGHAYTRATYTTISEDRFTWRGEKSADRKTWTEFMVVEAHRI